MSNNQDTTSKTSTKKSSGKKTKKNLKSRSITSRKGNTIDLNSAKTHRSGALWLAIFLSIFAIIIAVYSWYVTAVQGRIDFGLQKNNIQSLNTQVEQLNKNGNVQTNAVTSLGSKLVQIENKVLQQLAGIKADVAFSKREISEEFIGANGAMVEQVDQLKQELLSTTQSINKLHHQVFANADDWGLQEVEQLILIAQQRLRFFQDPTTAADALQVADNRLQQLSDVNVNIVQQSIKQDIEKLSLMKNTDLLTTLDSLAALADGIDSLMLVGDVSVVTDSTDTAATSESNSKNNNNQLSQIQENSFGQSLLDAGSRLIDTVTDLIQVENKNQPVKRIVSTEGRQLVYARVKLLLDSAQLALIRQQIDIYHNRMVLTHSWVVGNFQQSNQTQKWLAQLDQLTNDLPVSKWPDLQQSLSVLRQMRAARKNQIQDK